MGYGNKIDIMRRKAPISSRRAPGTANGQNSTEETPSLQDRGTLPATRLPQAGGTTLALEIVRELRNDINNAVLEPGKKLHIQNLCTRFDVGLSPVREALNRLSSEGLLTQSAQKGFTVSEISITDFVELNLARRSVNDAALRQSIARGNQAWEERVILSFYRLSRIPRYTNENGAERNPIWNQAHKSFHGALLDACESKWLEGFCDTMFDAAERYRALARLLDRDHTRASVADDEHRGIMEAALNRDADRAVELLNAHFDRTAELVRASLELREARLGAVSKRSGRS